MFDLAGIKRSLEFSPNHRGNDNAIFTSTVEELKKLGCVVTLYSEDDLLLCESVEEQYLFTMSRSKQSVQKLQRLEKEGKMVVNSAFAIEQCFRANMTAVLTKQSIPYPKSFIVSTARRACEAFTELGGKNFWIKRGDFHAIHKEDVSFAHTPSQANDILKEYSLRGIGEAVISEHLFGDLVKFYGVRGTDFFHWFYPYEFNHSKYNAEMINGAANYYDFSIDALKGYGHQAAEALGVFIYGGDAIISQTGNIRIIDLNDWPSFAPCREEASYHIAQCIYKKADAHAKISSVL